MIDYQYNLFIERTSFLKKIRFQIFDKYIKKIIIGYKYIQVLLLIYYTPMKKLLLTLGLMSILGGLISTASASSTSCKDVEFSNGVTVCVNISDAGTDRRELTADVDG